MAKPLKKTKTKRIGRKKVEEIELRADAWERFEKGLKTIAKAKPSHSPAPKPAKRGKARKRGPSV